MIRISAQTHITRACGATSKRYVRIGDFNDFNFSNCVFLVVFSNNNQLCLVENRESAFDQVSKFDRGRIVAYRDCGLSVREIDSRVGRNQTTVMRICDLSARTIRRRLQQSGLSKRRPLLGLPLMQNYRRLCRQWCNERRMSEAEWNEVVFIDASHASVCNTTMFGFESGDTVVTEC
ncbi:HTH_Tnp_Tc3_2 domain-containing protein [Trichonephila clavipes]|nr:HTH_Tnp_Tc3_2 domain-containing protein [Trichonephila clavipes]